MPGEMALANLIKILMKVIWRALRPSLRAFLRCRNMSLFIYEANYGLLAGGILSRDLANLLGQEKLVIFPLPIIPT